MRASATTASYLRVASIGIGAYDYLLTIPAEWRFYRAQHCLGHLSQSCFLFILIRYLSIVLIVISNFAWFGSFTVESCHRWYLLPPIFKVFQTMVSQFVLGMRAFNLSKRSRHIAWALVMLYCAACTAQWVMSIYKRYPTIGPRMRCQAVSYPPQYGPWLFYTVAIIYDFLITVMSFKYLLKYHFSATTSLITNVTKMMLYDGMGYFVLLTVSNIINIVLYRTNENTQSAGVSVGYVLTWIMTQRLLIHLNDAVIKRRDASRLGNAVVTITNTESDQDISRAARSQFMSTKEHEWTIPDLDSTSAVERGEHIGVHIQVERTVQVEDSRHTYEMNISNIHRPPAKWTSHETLSGYAGDMRDVRDDWLMSTRR